ncbi:MAG: winged helix-turn-helix transcriptional regulator [Lentisphaeria bacterium]|nr:winged helix-turn-helix transcriptional regulator [Lentisphaeria bacterium]
MGQYKDTKAKRAEEELLRQIKQGNYPRGSQLPPTQELARQLDVSHMTIRKIVAKLTADGYLYNIPRVGTYINKELPDSKLRYQLGIVLPAYATPYLTETMLELQSVLRKVTGCAVLPLSATGKIWPFRNFRIIQMLWSFIPSALSRRKMKKSGVFLKNQPNRWFISATRMSLQSIPYLLMTRLASVSYWKHSAGTVIVKSAL